MTTAHWTDRVRRVRDTGIAVFLLLILLPVLGMCALGVVLVDGPPILYRQLRHGYGGEPFTILKFRTMRSVPGTMITAAGDPRITRIGRILRRWKLDELPQLWNVARGDMSLVGPRPEVPEIVEQAAFRFRGLTDIRPGLTDWASLAFLNESVLLAHHDDPHTFYIERLLPRKLALARLYRRHQSSLVDARILLATACGVIGLDRLAARCAGRALLTRARVGLDA